MYRAGTVICEQDPQADEHGLKVGQLGDDDFDQINEMIGQIRGEMPKGTPKDLRAEISSAIVKALAYTGQVDQARRKVKEIAVHFWRAEAMVAITSMTHREEDFRELRAVAARINSADRQMDVSGEIGCLRHQMNERESPAEPCQRRAERVLSSVLSRVSR
tara:strand:+ start:243 stop:725 length:483 start_codon:yes stop_codon:yes gene_type:complete